MRLAFKLGQGLHAGALHGVAYFQTPQSSGGLTKKRFCFVIFDLKVSEMMVGSLVLKDWLLNSSFVPSDTSVRKIHVHPCRLSLHTRSYRATIRCLSRQKTLRRLS